MLGIRESLLSRTAKRPRRRSFIRAVISRNLDLIYIGHFEVRTVLIRFSRSPSTAQNRRTWMVPTSPPSEWNACLQEGFGTSKPGQNAQSVLCSLNPTKKLKASQLYFFSTGHLCYLDTISPFHANYWFDIDPNPNDTFKIGDVR